MPNQITGVTITPNQDGTTCNVQVGPNGYTVNIADLFVRNNFDADHLLDNIRLRRIIGGYSVLWSEEFVNSINTNGVRLPCGDYYNVGFTVNPDESVTVAFGSTVGQSPNETITTTPDFLADDTHNIDLVVKNVKSFLRIANFSNLTTPAASGIYAGKTASQAVATWTFRY